MELPSIISALRNAHDEIVNLRRRNEILEAKVEVIDTFTAIVRGLERRGGGIMGEDVVCRLRDLVDRLDAERRAQSSAEAAAEAAREADEIAELN